MKLAIVLLAFFTTFSLTINAQITRRIGTNLSGIVDYSSEFVFVDVFKQSREWIAHEIPGGSPWSSGVNVPLGSNGYPLEIPYNNGVNPPQAVRSLLFFGDLNGLYPSGSYRLIASGSGQIQLFGAASGTFNCPVDTVVNVSSSGGVIIDLVQSQVSNPVHDIRFVMPGFHSTFQTDPFHPKLLSFLQDFQVIRFMDWQSTNFSTVSNWSDRNSPNYYTQTLQNGVAPEILIDLSNRLGKDPWICIPHLATNDYIVQYANLLRNTLDTSLTIHVEYSNEVWNSQFTQSQHNDSMGNALGYSGPPWEQGWKYYAKRTADIFHLFDSVFVGTDRLAKVISSQAGNPWLSNEILNFFDSPIYNPTQVQADMLAIAPYFGGIADELGNAGLAASCTVSQILDSMEAQMQETFTWMMDTKTIADNHNVDLASYEGGQHLVAGYAYHNDTAFVNKLIAANRHPRMEDMYCDYFNFWYDSVSPSVFCQFSSHYVPTKYGSWGVKENYDDTLSPKYLGLQNCVFAFNSSTADIKEISEDELAIVIYPNPVNSVLNLKYDNDAIHSFQIRSIEGKTILESNIVPSIDGSRLSNGMYTISFFDKNQKLLKTVKFLKI